MQRDGLRCAEMRADRAEMRVRAGAREGWVQRVEARFVRVRRETCVLSYIQHVHAHVSERRKESSSTLLGIGCVCSSSSSAGGTDKAALYGQHP